MGNNLILISTIIFSIIGVTTCSDVKVKIDFNGRGVRLKHFWKSTGLCPPDPKNEVYKFLLSDDEKLNLALIGALPNRSIKHVRIHWLLNLISIRFDNGSLIYNFTYLDSLLDWIHDQKLYPGFELMGTPLLFEKARKQIDHITLRSYKYWYDIVLSITNRYVERYGIKNVQRWRFETWNEPDLKHYNILNLTLSDYLVYVQACADALLDTFKSENSTTQKRLKLGGPAGLFKDPKKHPLCWGLLRKCNKRKRRTCPIQFISFHKKGDGTAAQVLNKGLELLDLIHSKFPNIRQIPVANDEADILTNWSKSEEWRGDVRYAAMMVKVILDHFKKMVVDMKVTIEVLSNDNAFLNYHPYYFTQRTLFTRFQMNDTSPPHIQFVKKPAYSVMGLLSLLGEVYLKEDVMSSDPLVEFLATRSRKNTKHKFQTTSLLITFVNNTEGNNNSTKRINAVFNNLPDFDSKYVIYVLDNLITNPFLSWKNAGSPVFPEKRLREKMRGSEEPFRLQGPSSIVTSTLEIELNLTLPAVAFIHICSRSLEPPGRVTHLKAYNVTSNEVLLIWKDTKVRSKCIRTYEVEFQPEKVQNYSAFPAFRRVNSRDIIFLSYHHVATGGSTGEATRGRYRVRAVDYWNTPGKYSKFLSYPTN